MFLAATLFCITTSSFAVEPSKISTAVTSLIKTSCIECHNKDEQNGSHRFDNLPALVEDEAIAQRWQDILDVLNLDQMPPDEADQPSPEELADVLETLTDNLRQARQRLTDSGGEVVVRRLNRREYGETIKTLLGVPIETDMLPDSATVEGFDTIGSAQSVSSLHLERYLLLGRKALDRAIPSDRKTQRPYHRMEQAEDRPNRHIGEKLTGLEDRRDKHIKLVADGKERLQEAVDATVEEIRLTRQYLAAPGAESGALIPFHGLNPEIHCHIHGNQAVGKFRFRVKCGAEADKTADGLYLKVVRGEWRSDTPDEVYYFEVKGTRQDPQTIEFVAELDAGIRSNRFGFERRHYDYKLLPQYLETPEYYFTYREVAYLLEDDFPDIWIDSIEVEGPLDEATAPLAAERLLGELNRDKATDEQVRKIIERFAFEAFRHQQPTREYVDQLLAIYTTARARGIAFEDALKDALTVVLASPRFLFLGETQADGEQREPLADRELAVRLAYFLWSAPPDAELYQAAAAGKLHDLAVLRRQVDRMLTHPRSELFVETFLEQWLELNRLNHIDPETTGIAEYDDAVKRHSRREVIKYFAHLLQQNKSVENLIDSDFVVVDSIMAQFYGLPGVGGDEFRAVTLPGGSIRGGLLGQSAILTLTGTGQRTSPVERGVYVLRKLLDRPPPPAPANVPMLDESTVGERSIRETLGNHMMKTQCNSCHRRIDSLGYALENFDPVGRWRTSVLSSSGAKEFPIETAGLMPDGKRHFDGYHELKRHLRDDRRQMVRGLTEALMTYGLGRTVTFSDQGHVEQIVRQTANDGNGLRDLLYYVVESEPFLTK
ncbi:DUF1592 domain-containing protein [Bremerella sp.]|uniref:DUF1592 domain-containing protein n=1 Tax=Bremerella sp. TaxID=2795602 RepID=UPI0039197AC6